MFPCEMSGCIAGFRRYARKMGRIRGESGVKTCPFGLLGHHFHSAVLQAVDTSNHLDFFLLDGGGEDRGRGFELCDIVDHVLPGIPGFLDVPRADNRGMLHDDGPPCRLRAARGDSCYCCEAGSRH